MFDTRGSSAIFKKELAIKKKKISRACLHIAKGLAKKRFPTPIAAATRISALHNTLKKITWECVATKEQEQTAFKPSCTSTSVAQLPTRNYQVGSSISI